MLGQGAEAEGPWCEASGGLGTSQLDLESSPRVGPVPALQLLRAEIMAVLGPPQGGRGRSVQ